MMKNLGMLLLLMSLLLIKKFAVGATCSSTKSGDWTDPTVWSCGHSPVAGDSVKIINGTTVTVNSNIAISGNPMQVVVYGNLYFIKKLMLPSKSCVTIQPNGALYGDGTGSSSDYLAIDNIELWAGECNGNGGSSYEYCGSINGYKQICDISLPVTLTDFKAMRAGSNILVTWSTIQEHDLAFFTLQESKNLMEFTDVSYVMGGGSVYIYTAPYTSNSYFRLRSTNVDGSSQYSKIIYLNNNPSDTTITYTYNPAVKKLIISNATTVELLDVTGKQLIKYANRPSEIDVSGIITGAYIIILSNDTQTVKEKINIY